MFAFDQLLHCLTDVRSADAPGGHTSWTTGTLGLENGHIFGGQMIGQSVTIASRVNPDHAVKSVSVIFPRGARDTGSLVYDVNTLHSGSVYATTYMSLSQPDRHGVPAAGMSAHVLHRRPTAPEVSIEHSAPMPEAGSPADARRVDLGLIPWDTRIVGTTDMSDRSAQPCDLRMWMRIERDLPDDDAVHQALFAFASELNLIGTALLPHEGWSLLDAHRSLRTSVIAHTVLFHRPFRLDEWLLLAQTSPAASGGSAYGVGNLFTESGEVVASISQESMIRIEDEYTRT
jgi:acyl-CoA thioesterase-2